MTNRLEIWPISGTHPISKMRVNFRVLSESWKAACDVAKGFGYTHLYHGELHRKVRVTPPQPTGSHTSAS